MCIRDSKKIAKYVQVQSRVEQQTTDKVMMLIPPPLKYVNSSPAISLSFNNKITLLAERTSSHDFTQDWRSYYIIYNWPDNTWTCVYTLYVLKWHTSNSCKTLIGVHEMHGRMHPKLRSCNYFVGPWRPFIISLLYDHPHPSSSRQLAYKNFGC